MGQTGAYFDSAKQYTNNVEVNPGSPFDEGDTLEAKFNGMEQKLSYWMQPEIG
jgi:hypothetical protein